MTTGPNLGKQFANNIREHRTTIPRNQRQRLGYSAEAIAQEMRRQGFNTWRQSTLSKIEHHERDIKLAEAITLCGILGTNLGDILNADRPTHLKAV